MRWGEFRRGFLAVLPLLAGVAPFGMIYGLLAVQAGMPALAAQAMSSIVFAGSSQFVAAQLFGTVPAPILILTIFVVNLRHALYSATLAPYFAKLSAGWKALLSYLLVDEAFAVSFARLNEAPAGVPVHWHFFGAGVGLWTGWQISSALGIFLGAQIPASWSLDFTLALTFIALVVPGLRDRPTVAAALVGGVTAVLLYPIPLKLGLIAAALAGILAGLLGEKVWQTSG